MLEKRIWEENDQHILEEQILITSSDQF